MRVNTMVLIASWLSIFAMAWLTIFGITPRQPMTGAGFIFFFLIAFLSGAMENSNQSKKE